MDPDNASQVMLALASRVDLFTIWVTVLLAIGLHVVGKIPQAGGDCGRDHVGRWRAAGAARSVERGLMGQSIPTRPLTAAISFAES